MSMIDAAVVDHTAAPDEVEMWENPGKSRHVIKKLGERGFLVDVMVNGGRRFHITPRERRINMELAATPQQDPFTNGTFRPVSLIDGDPDTAKLLDNPNVMSEQAMAALFKAPKAAFLARIAEITLPRTLEELLKLADSEKIGARVAQKNAITERLAAITPDLSITTAPPAATGGPPVPGAAPDPAAGGFRGVTPQ